jgi:glyoxylase-like metal-dependent hydrolase (beta-lactamase superfamily II)
MALVACPTGSIGGATGEKVDAAATRFPEPLTPDVLYCGFTSPDSFGASSYLILRPGGNVLVDSPRRSRRLLERLRSFGPVQLLFLTHRDDVADHAFYARELGCTRVLHAADVTAGTRDVEHQLTGSEPVLLQEDLLAIPAPGHTPGSTALLFRNRYLFSGDHLWASAEAGLHASRNVCWYSWPEQIRSVERLLAHDFCDVLPGHGGRLTASSPQEMRAHVSALLHRLRRAG